MQDLYYGVKEGELVHISAVEKGLGCNCVCPACGGTLIAKKGAQRTHHFAHYRVEDCGKGRESALHIMAKNILQQTKRAFVPLETENENGCIRRFERVEIEPRSFTGFIPDVLAIGATRELNIEILVSHAVDDEKKKRIMAADLATIEIDLSSLVDSFDPETVTKAMISGKHTKWIFSPVIEKHKRTRLDQQQLCDFLEPVHGKYDCPLCYDQVDFLFGYHSCHECRFYEHTNALVTHPVIACSFREKGMDKDGVTEVQNLQRERGRILSVDIRRNEVWEHWCGYEKGILCPGYTPQYEKQRRNVPGGKALADLWKPTYRAIGVHNLLNGNLMIINGHRGEMKTNANGVIVGKYYNPKNRTQKYSKEYPVRNAKDLIWELIKVFVYEKE